MFASSVVFKNSKDAKNVLLGIIISSTIVLIFQSLRLFMPEALSLGVLGGKTDNLVGFWNSFGLFVGFFVLLLLFVLEFFLTSKLVKFILGILLALSLLLVAAVNFLIIWELLGIIALIIFVYKLSFPPGIKQKEEGQTKGQTKGKAPFPIFSFVVVMASVLFFMAGNFIGGYIQNRLGLSNVEVSPSFSATMSVTKDALKKDPILGFGPNRFGEIWSMYKPKAINQTQFWDVPFNSGSGLLPTFASTTGGLGILAWLAFFVLFIMAGFKILFASINSGKNREVVIFFVASLYLFISSFFYSTGAVIFLLAFAFGGIFIGVSAANRNQEISISFLDDPRKSFFSILLLMLIMIFTAGVTFKYLERFASVSYFREALRATTLPAAESSIKKALSLYANDLYLRTYAQVYLVKLNEIVGKGSSSSDKAKDKADIEASFGQAVSGAMLATTHNPANYLNFEMLGSIYGAAVSFGDSGAYDKAIETYKIAGTLNPLNPRIKLAMARVSFAGGKDKEAKNYANEALSLKEDYIDALVILSQIVKNEGNNEAALTYAERAFSLAPANQDLSKYVDSLKNSSPASASTKETSVKKK